jgi:hypothetical protein
MTGLKLNLGCGENHLEGWVNVDKFGNPDVKHDLEIFPWPWVDNSVIEVFLNHVLEHLGRDTDTYLNIIKELYRVCQYKAQIKIIVPHHRHDFFFDDPTHVRVVTPLGLQLFSQRLNQEWIKGGTANSPLGLYLGVNFELIETKYKPSSHWFNLHPEPDVDIELLLSESIYYNNLIEEIQMLLEVVKFSNLATI